MVQEDAIYKSEVTGDLVEVLSVPDRFGTTDPDNQTIEVEGVEDGEWSTVFRDNFRKGFRKVADSREDLDEAMIGSQQ